MKCSIDSIETFGLVDGPGIRTVVFLNGCKLRCKFCHNPETWQIREFNYETDEIVERILRNKNYFKNNGGVTFSGGEPLLQIDSLIDMCNKLKKENIHIAIDTAGIGNGEYKELFSTIDMVLLDVKHINREGYIEVTQTDNLDKFFNFVEELNKTNVEVWIRQVIIPEVNDNIEYIKGLSKFIKTHIKNVKRVDFLPYHKMGEEKYIKLGIPSPYKDKEAMNKDKCDYLYQEFLKDFNEN